MPTKAQVNELKRLLQEPQCTYGKGRARVQNNLVRLGLAKFLFGGNECRITNAGRACVEIPSSPPPGKESGRG